MEETQCFLNCKAEIEKVFPKYCRAFHNSCGLQKKASNNAQKANVEDEELKDTESQKFVRGFGRVRKVELGA